MFKFAVLGAGSWGMAIAAHLVRCQQTVCVWGRDNTALQHLKRQHTHPRYLPDLSFPTAIHYTPDLSEALLATHLVLAVPSDAIPALLNLLKSHIKPTHRLLSLAKGLDPTHHHLLHHTVEHFLGNVPYALLSGPSFAREVALGLPTAVVVASQSASLAHTYQHDLHSPHFRVYTSTDLIGVEVGGIVKNVLALAVGLSDGLGCGANARAALITRGLTEMLRLGVVLGAEAETLYGLAGLGDLVLTATDDQSRNRRCGYLLGRGNTLSEAENLIGSVIEGVRNAPPLAKLAKTHGIEMPIVERIAAIVQGHESPTETMDLLLQRPAKLGN